MRTVHDSSILLAIIEDSSCIERVLRYVGYVKTNITQTLASREALAEHQANDKTASKVQDIVCLGLSATILAERMVNTQIRKICELHIGVSDELREAVEKMQEAQALVAILVDQEAVTSISLANGDN